MPSNVSFINFGIFKRNNIMTITYQPTEVLKPYVAYYYSIKWERCNYKDGIYELLLPSGMCFMSFQLTGRFTGIIDNRKIKPKKYYTMGQQTDKYIMFSDNDVIELEGAAFTPTGLYHLFGCNMVNLINNPIDTQLLIEDLRDGFTQEYASEMDPINRINLIENLLINQTQKHFSKANIIDTAIAMIRRHKGCWSIKQITDKLNVSERYFQKMFKLMIGITPSTYNRIIRFNCLFAEMKSVSPQDYNTLSSLYYYFDFAHFSKDFKKYCGESPSKFNIEQFHFLKENWVDKYL